MALQLKHRSLFELIGIAQSIDALHWIKRVHDFEGALEVCAAYTLNEFERKVRVAKNKNAECTWYVQGDFAHSYKEALILAIEFELGSEPDE